jgi:hypothetical protein
VSPTCGSTGPISRVDGTHIDPTISPRAGLPSRCEPGTRVAIISSLNMCALVPTIFTSPRKRRPQWHPPDRTDTSPHKQSDTHRPPNLVAILALFRASLVTGNVVLCTRTPTQWTMTPLGRGFPMAHQPRWDSHLVVWLPGGAATTTDLQYNRRGLGVLTRSTSQGLKHRYTQEPCTVSCTWDPSHLLPWNSRWTPFALGVHGLCRSSAHQIHFFRSCRLLFPS